MNWFSFSSIANSQCLSNLTSWKFLDSIYDKNARLQLIFLMECLVVTHFDGSLMMRFIGWLWMNFYSFGRLELSLPCSCISSWGTTNSSSSSFSTNPYWDSSLPCAISKFSMLSSIPIFLEAFLEDRSLYHQRPYEPILQLLKYVY